MRIAVIGDIHGNIYALDAVLEDIQTKEVDLILSTGDLVGYFPFPNEVVETISNNRILSIQGNHDESFASFEPVVEDDFKHLTTKEIQANASRIYTNYVLKTRNREYLKNLPKQLKLEFEGYSLLLVHGSPRKNDEYMHESSNDLSTIVQDVSENIIISGHTHIPYYQIISDKHMINAGSVGKPKHGNPNATYVIINLVDENIQVEIKEVPYPFEQLVDDIIHNDMISNDLIDYVKKGI